ncbi:precorrin-2 C(20)-methyltransferase [Desulfobaculum senezii]
MNYGTLYGIGVGPGDPEFLTLKAVRVLGGVDRIFAAASSKNTYSVSYDIVRPHLKADVAVQTLDFPMTKDREVLRAAWTKNAEAVLDAMKRGENVAFLTLGDPLTYSTFGYLLRTLREMVPNAPVEIIPGITSYNAAAAAAQTVLVEAEESLTIVSGAKGGDRVRTIADCTDSLVVLKTYRQFGDITTALSEGLRLEDAVLVSNCSMEGECVVRDLEPGMPAPKYFSLIISTPRR